MFNRKTTVSSIEERRNELVTEVRHVRDVLMGCVRAAVAYNQMLSILPKNTTEYKETALSAEGAKEDVVEWMRSYDCAIEELNDYCVENNLRQSGFISARQVVLNTLAYRKN